MSPEPPTSNVVRMTHSGPTTVNPVARHGKVDHGAAGARRRTLLRRTRVSSATAPAPEHVAVRAVDVRKSYGKAETAVTALAGVSLDVQRGQFAAVMGPSGSGKSTLMHCLAGLDRVDSGDVQVGGVSIVDMNDKALTALRRDRVGFVFQQYNLLPTLTAEENILLPLAIAGRKPDHAWLDEVVRAVGLGDRLSHRPAELSGGQQQRVACARALITRPDVVFADEPTGNLDSRAGAEVLAFLARCVEEFGQTVVMVTHDPGAASYAGRVVFLADGLTVDEMVDPTSERVLDRMKMFDAAGHVIAETAV
jgi:putative ABC transport system ATP-binding protein